MGLRAGLCSLGLCAALCLGACGFDDTPTGGACVQGMRTACPCSGGVIGGQTCGTNGTFGSCDCSLPAGVGGSGSLGSTSRDAGPGSTGTPSGDAGHASGGAPGAGSGAAGSQAAGTGGSGDSGSGGTGGGSAGTSTAGQGGASGGGGTGDAGQGGSMATVCDPGFLACGMSGAISWVTRCNADGTAFEPDHPCSGYEACRGGACHCLPNRVFCKDNELRVCDAAGDQSSVLQTCDGEQMCNATTRTCQRPCRPDGCSCEGSGEPCCTAAGVCGCTGRLGLACTPTNNGDAMCSCG